MSLLRKRSSSTTARQIARCGICALLGLLISPALARAEGPLSPGFANLDFRKLIEAGGGVGIVIGALSVGMVGLCSNT
jgi:hypothetical protein